MLGTNSSLNEEYGSSIRRSSLLLEDDVEVDIGTCTVLDEDGVIIVPDDVAFVVSLVLLLLLL